MKIKGYGYARRKVSDEGLLELEEVSIAASADELRRIAAFFIRSAEEVEKHGAAFGHAHLLERRGDGILDIIVCRREEEPIQPPETTRGK